MTETAAYEITGQIGEIELRRYPQLFLATVNDSGEDSGFDLLFRYITGNNHIREKIPMTAPVITSEKIPMTTPVITSERIPMTAPVVSDEQSMSFVMPAGKKREELPDPLDTRVHLTALPPREVAVIRFKGYARQKEVDNAKSRMMDDLKKAGITTRGQFFLMRYNPPWTPGFLRRNEVGIEIAR
jgi:hypothetical protein